MSGAAALDLGVYLVTAQPASEATVDVAVAAAAGGVRVVQLRDKSAGSERRIELLRRLRRSLPGDVTLIVDDDVAAAAAVPGVGVHVGPGDVHPAEARLMVGDEVPVGWSIGDRRQLADGAALAAASYVAASPVWPTPTKDDTGAPWGLDGVRRLRASLPATLPLVGIGGIDAGNAADVIAAGADGVAVVSAICAAGDPRQAAAQLRRAVDEAMRRGGS